VNKLLLLLPIAFIAFLATAQPSPPAKVPPRSEPHRSPIDVAVLPGDKRALTANHTADSVSLVDLGAGKLLAELPCGHKPAAVACSRDGRRAAVSNLWSGTLTLLELREAALHKVAEVPLGPQPRGIAFAPDGNILYVAVAGANEVVQFDWDKRKVMHRWPAAGEPRRLALTRDGRFLAAASSRSAQVRCWDTNSGKLHWERSFNEDFNLLGLALGPDDKELFTAHMHDRHHPIGKVNIENSWALDSRLGRLTVQPDATTDSWQIALDQRGAAVGDPCAVACSSKGEYLVAAAAGTQELLVLPRAEVPWNGGEPPDFLDTRLVLGENKLRRVTLGGRPVAVQFLAGAPRAVVANYLLDALQIVDAKSGKITQTIALGGPERPDLARRGEAIFYDALRSHHHWFSCATCHTDGHTACRTFDTLNDESFGNPKMTPTLRGVTRTGPWTWHGWQDNLGAAVEKSLTETLYGPKPTEDDVKAMVAFLGTLDHPPNPHMRPDGSRSVAAERGKALFQGKARCARCHHGPDYTSTKTYDVKLPDDSSPYTKWSPPSLRGVWDRAPYLHDGSAETLDDVLRSFHAPEKLGGEALTPEERSDLIEFLKSL
jgi:DNA-binding beta-propeller fold protein YncE